MRPPVEAIVNGRRVPVLVRTARGFRFARPADVRPGYRVAGYLGRRNPDPETERFLAEQAARGMRDPESRSFLAREVARGRPAALGGFLEAEVAGGPRRGRQTRKPAQASLFSGEELGAPQRELFRRRNPWITRRGRRIEIDPAGRILRGQARDLRGVQIGALPDYWREFRKLSDPQLCPEPTGARTYRSKGEAYAALLDANPMLAEFLESVGGAGVVGPRLRQERRAGQRFGGAEPGIDVIAQYLNTKPEHLGSFANAVYRLIPGKGPHGLPRWSDLERRLPILRDALDSNMGWRGRDLNIPERAARLGALDAERDLCRSAVDAEIGGLGQKYRELTALEEAPF